MEAEERDTKAALHELINQANQLRQALSTFKKLVNRLTEQVNAHADERNRCASAAKEAGLGCGDDSGGCGLFRVLLGTFLYQAAGNTMF